MFDRAVRSDDASPAACRAAVDAVRGGAGAVVLLLADQPGLDVAAIAQALGPEPVTGAVFPALIEGTELITHGALALALDPPVQRAMVSSTFEPREVIASLVLPALAPRADAVAQPSLLVLVDGYAAGSATALLAALRLPYLHMGARVIGGGAGYARLGAQPCLFTERGPLPRGAAVVLRVEAQISVAAEHGWSRLAGPFLATRTDHTTVCELNWRPARDVYTEAIGREPDPRLAMQHPLAILGPRDTMSIRDPLSFTADGGIYTFGDVGERALIAVMHAEPDSLVGAAGAAARAALIDAPSSPRTSLFFDCVSRADALVGRFSEELQRIARESTPRLWGALSLGEIASNGERGAEFHNKTLVVATR